LVPVDQELAGASVKGEEPVLKARVIESPVEAMESGQPLVTALEAEAIGAMRIERMTVSESEMDKSDFVGVIRFIARTPTSYITYIKGSTNE